MVEQIKQFILSEYGVTLERPFKDDDVVVFRNKHNKKWFAVIMKIPASRMGLKSERLIDIINLKNHPADVSMLRAVDGIFPAYHMNKENWFSVMLDADVPFDLIVSLIDQSYNIINNKRK